MLEIFLCRGFTKAGGFRKLGDLFARTFLKHRDFWKRGGVS